MIADIAARAIIHSGSYMLYERHGAAPEPGLFENIRLETPNYSGRMDNLRAALIRDGLAALDRQVERWNRRYRVLEEGFRRVDGITLPERSPRERYVGSSIQFRVEVETLDTVDIPAFVAACGERGVELKWFGEAAPRGFTSRYDSWRYLGEQPVLPRTLDILARTLDMRVPLTFTEDDCRQITAIVGEVMAER